MGERWSGSESHLLEGPSVSNIELWGYATSRMMMMVIMMIMMMITIIKIIMNYS
jgi:hypothetical protein